MTRKVRDLAYVVVVVIYALLRGTKNLASSMAGGGGGVTQFWAIFEKGPMSRHIHWSYGHFRHTEIAGKLAQ